MRRLALALAALLLAGCYRVTVVTSTAPTATQVNKEWQNSFVAGLVPPPELNVKEQCPQGIAKVVTERSFLNGLVAALTQSIYTPMHTTVTCASR
jgi:Bor protein